MRPSASCADLTIRATAALRRGWKLLRTLAVRPAAMAIGAVLVSTATAAAYPERAITIIVPYPVGGATDTLSRVVGAKMGEIMGTTVVIENRSGGSGMIGLTAAARAPADGYTMVLGAVSDIAILTAASPTAPPVSLDRDFVAVGGIANSPHILVVASTLQATTVEQLTSVLKASPGKHNFASIGVATLSQLEGNLLMQTTGVDIVHVPYRGGAQALQELIMGNSSLMFLSGPNAVPHVKSGKVHVLAVAADQRLGLLPSVPTFTEAGVKGFNAPNRMGFYTAKGTPPAIVDQLSRALGRALDQPDIKARLAQAGMVPSYVNSAEFNRMTTEDLRYFDDLVKRNKIRLE
jgi:tripartite-type tricarboxylate transporter receptor subunit TctC